MAADGPNGPIIIRPVNPSTHWQPNPKGSAHLPHTQLISTCATRAQMISIVVPPHQYFSDVSEAISEGTVPLIRPCLLCTMQHMHRTKTLQI